MDRSEMNRAMKREQAKQIWKSMNKQPTRKTPLSKRKAQKLARRRNR